MVSSIKRTDQAAYVPGHDFSRAHMSGSLVEAILCRQGAVVCAIVDRVVLVEHRALLLKPSWTHQEHIIHFHMEMK